MYIQLKHTELEKKVYKIGLWHHEEFLEWLEKRKEMNIQGKKALWQLLVFGVNLLFPISLANHMVKVIQSERLC